MKNKMAFGQMPQADSPAPNLQGQGTPTNAPTPGDIDSGYRYKGGPPNDSNSWEQVTQ
jgi:hypothetical protein